MSLQDDLSELQRKVDEQGGRLRSFETYAKAAIIVAVIFGIGGAWGASAVAKARETISELNERLSTLNEKATQLDAQVSRSADAIEGAKQKALADVAARLPLILKESNAVRRCRVCYRVVGSDGGNQGGQCAGDLSGCSSWSDSPDWSSFYGDDTDNRNGWCQMSWKLECE